MSLEADLIQTKYYEKLNISVLNIAEVKKVIKMDIKNTLNAWDRGKDVMKQTFHIIGAAGIGKTAINGQIVKELTEELHKEFLLILAKSPVLLKDDMLIPFPVRSIGSNEVDSYKMLYSEFIPKHKDTYGIFLIDEFSRGDHTLQQLFWQIQDEYQIHQHKFPKGWFVVSTDNPDDSEYKMNNLEDAAGLRRQLHLYAQVSPRVFLDYAISENFHPLIIDFIQTNPDYVYDFESQRKGSVYSNPASLHKLSDHLWKYEWGDGIMENLDIIESLSSGLINLNITQIFVDFIKQREKHIQPKEIFFEYDKVRRKILTMIDDNDNGRLSNIVVGFCTYLSTTRPTYTDKELTNVANFLVDLPVDMATVFTTYIDKLPREEKAFTYLQLLNSMLLNNDKYKKEFYEKAVDTAGG